MKVFGVGLSKTGTTSLTKALEIMGYKAIHNPSYLLTLEDGILNLDYEEVKKYEALTDIQISRFYKELDVIFPGSKFILTTRELNSWLGSCKNHFNEHRKVAPKVQALDIDVYGTDLFDIDIFRRAYSQHYNEIIDYFSGREGDLLLLDISERNKWAKLSVFLNKPVPDEAYPVSNKAIPIPIAIKNIFRRFETGRKAIKAIKKVIHRW